MVWIRFVRFPPYFQAYERQLAKQRYFTRDGSPGPRARSGRSRPPATAPPLRPRVTPMPIEVRRFGVGHRRPDGPPGTTGIRARSSRADGRGSIAELAFDRARRGSTPHRNPNSTWFIVIEGGGWVGVGDERTRVAAGEAVALAAGRDPRRVDRRVADARDRRRVPGPDDSAVRGILAGSARELLPGEPHAERGEGALAPGADAVPHDRSEGEPV